MTCTVTGELRGRVHAITAVHDPKRNLRHRVVAEVVAYEPNGVTVRAREEHVVADGLLEWEAAALAHEMQPWLGRRVVLTPAGMREEHRP